MTKTETAIFRALYSAQAGKLPIDTSRLKRETQRWLAMVERTDLELPRALSLIRAGIAVDQIFDDDVQSMSEDELKALAALSDPVRDKTFRPKPTFVNRTKRAATNQEQSA